MFIFKIKIYKMESCRIKNYKGTNYHSKNELLNTPKIEKKYLWINTFRRVF